MVNDGEGDCRYVDCGAKHGEVVANLKNLRSRVCWIDEKVQQFDVDRLESYKEIAAKLETKTSLKIFMWVTAGLATLIFVLNALQWDSTRAAAVIEKTVSEKMSEMKADLAVIKEQVSKFNSDTEKR
jgi:hypothetical protein